MKMQVNEQQDLPVCNKSIQEEVHAQAAKRPGPDRTLCEALLLQAANYAET